VPDYPDWNDAKAVAAWLGKPPRPFNPHDAAAQEWVKRRLVLHRQAALDELHRRADATDDPESPVETIARWFSEQQGVAIDTAEHGNWQPLADMRRSWSKEVREQFNLQYSDRVERLTADRLQDKVKREGKPRALEGAWSDKDLAAMTAKVIQNILDETYPGPNHRLNAIIAAAILYDIEPGKLQEYVRGGGRRKRRQPDQTP
jgi:hypothetical protein